MMTYPLGLQKKKAFVRDSVYNSSVWNKNLTAWFTDKNFRDCDENLDGVLSILQHRNKDMQLLKIISTY